MIVAASEEHVSAIGSGWGADPVSLVGRIVGTEDSPRSCSTSPSPRTPISSSTTGAVALAGGRHTRRRLGRCSDGEGEFGEDGCEPVVRIEISGEFVVASAEILDERTPRADHSR